MSPTEKKTGMRVLYYSRFDVQAPTSWELRVLKKCGVEGGSLNSDVNT